LKDILKGSAVIFLFKAVGAASLFGVHLLIARHYGASTLGVFNLVLALLAFSAIFSRLGLDMYVVRVLPGIENDKTSVTGFIQKTFKLLFVGSVVSMLLVMISSSLINQYIFKSFDASSYLIALAVLLIPFTYFSVIPEIFRGFQDIKIYSFYRNLAQNFLVLLILAFFIYFLNITLDPIWVLYAVLFIIAIVIACHLYSFLKVKDISLSDKGNYKEKILIYSYPMLFTTSMIFLMGNVDSFLISYYLNEAQVGIYAVCLKISFLIAFVPASINGFIAPKISSAFAKKDYSEIKRIYKGSVKLILIATTPVLLILFIFPELILGIFGKEFANATVTLIIINMAFAINALFGLGAYLLNMTDNQKVLMKLLFVGLILNIGLNFLLIPSYQLNGAAFATFVSMSFWGIGSIIIAKAKKII
jgi:O-antigen/teichoic acid export membrane protein